MSGLPRVEEALGLSSTRFLVLLPQWPPHQEWLSSRVWGSEVVGGVLAS